MVKILKYELYNQLLGDVILLRVALGVRLDTAYFAENWKHYNKIIFKCINSVIGPIFNFFLNKVLVGPVNSTQDLLNSALCLLKRIHQKKYRGNAKCETRRRNQLNPNIY